MTPMTECEVKGHAAMIGGRLWARGAWLLAMAMVLVTATMVSGATAQQRPAIDPTADYVLRQASDYLAGLDAFVVHAGIIEDDWTDSGALVEFSRSVELAVRRPDRMWADARGDNGHKRYWYDGSTLTLMDYGFGTYARAAVPDSIDAVLETVAERFDVHVPLGDLAFSDLYTALTANVTSGTYVGLRTIDGVEYHHVAFSQESIDWQLWIENGQRPLPARMVITYKNEEGRPRFTATLSHWDVASALPEALFTFTPPPGAHKIEFVAPDSARQ